MDPGLRALQSRQTDGGGCRLAHGVFSTAGKRAPIGSRRQAVGPLPIGAEPALGEGGKGDFCRIARGQEIKKPPKSELAVDPSIHDDPPALPRGRALHAAGRWLPGGAKSTKRRGTAHRHRRHRHRRDQTRGASSLSRKMGGGSLGRKDPPARAAGGGAHDFPAAAHQDQASAGALASSSGAPSCATKVALGKRWTMATSVFSTWASPGMERFLTREILKKPPVHSSG